MEESNRDLGSGFEHVGDSDVYDGHLWKVVVGEFIAPDGSTFNRDIVRSPGAVAVVPLISQPGEEPQVVLVKQYRAAFNDFVIEIPAGMRDIAGEDPLDTAQRELIEESGYRAEHLELLHCFLPSPGMTDAVLHVFLGTDLTEVGRNAHGPEEEHMEVFMVPLAQATDMVLSGAIRDAKSTIGLLLAERHLIHAWINIADNGG